MLVSASCLRPFPALPGRGAHRQPSAGRAWLARLLAALLVATATELSPAAAGVIFNNCVTAADGSITCDTEPTGNTLMRDVDARFGLLDNASPGWAEFDPYSGYEDDFGGNET